MLSNSANIRQSIAQDLLETDVADLVKTDGFTFKFRSRFRTSITETARNGSVGSDVSFLLEQLAKACSRPRSCS
jgi:hypothetical protein